MAFSLVWGRVSHNLSHHLNDAVDLGERLTALLQIVVARVDIGLHRERRVIVARPLTGDRDRDSVRPSPSSAAPEAPLARRQRRCSALGGPRGARRATFARGQGITRLIRQSASSILHASAPITQLATAASRRLRGGTHRSTIANFRLPRDCPPLARVLAGHEEERPDWITEVSDEYNADQV
jgi:hypothetical protein